MKMKINRIHQKQNKGLLSAFAALLLLLVITAAAAVSIYADADDCYIGSVMLDGKDKIRVSLILGKDYEKEYKDGDVYIFAFAPWESVSGINDMSPLASAGVKKELEFSIPLYSGTASLLYHKFVAARLESDGSYTIITPAKYIKNPDALAEKYGTEPVPASKKGLQIQLASDAQLTGTAHTVVNVLANEILLSSYMPGSPGIEVDGRTVYFSAEKVAELDDRIRSYTDAGIVCYLNVMLGAPSFTMDAGLEVLYKNTESDSAALYAFNMSDEDSVYYIRALFEFLAERYTAQSGENGYAGRFIVGYEVNSNRIYNSAGEMDLGSYMYVYAPLLRMADAALRSHNPNGRVYVSLSSTWAAEGENPKLDYSARDFLTTLDSVAEYGGDFPWGVSLNAYASDITSSSTWKDPLAASGQDSPYVNTANLDVLTTFLTDSAYLYNGAVRDIIIGEFGVSADPASDAELANQAASYAFAYYKVQANPYIKAMIYHRHVDSAVESGLYFGLWSNRAGTTLTPDEKKPIYEIYKNIDVKPASEMTSHILSLLGADLWESAVPGVSGDTAAARQIIEGIALPETKEPTGRRDFLADFTEEEYYGVDGGEGTVEAVLSAVPAALLDSFEKSMRKSVLKDDALSVLALSLDGAFGAEYMGMDLPLDENALKRGHYAAVSCMVEMPDGVDGEKAGDFVTVMLRIVKNGTASSIPVIYEGLAQIRAGQWTELFFDIGEYTKAAGFAADSLKLWVLTPDDSAEAVNADGKSGYTLNIGAVSVYRDALMPGWAVALLIILGIVVLAALVFFGYVIYVRVRKRINSERRRRFYQQQMERERINAEKSEARRRAESDYTAIYGAQKRAATQQIQRPMGNTQQISRPGTTQQIPRQSGNTAQISRPTGAAQPPRRPAGTTQQIPRQNGNTAQIPRPTGAAQPPRRPSGMTQQTARPGNTAQIRRPNPALQQTMDFDSEATREVPIVTGADQNKN